MSENKVREAVLLENKSAGEVYTQELGITVTCYNDRANLAARAKQGSQRS